eukprot:15485760-Alexandrium_andersonii.AAC.1
MPVTPRLQRQSKQAGQRTPSVARLVRGPLWLRNGGPARSCRSPLGSGAATLTATCAHDECSYCWRAATLGTTTARMQQ